MSKYRTFKESSEDERYGSQFVCKNINKIDDFLNNLKKSYDLIENNNLDIKFNYLLNVNYKETEEIYNSKKIKSSYGDKKHYPKFDPNPQKISLKSAIFYMYNIDTEIEDKSIPKLDIINSIQRDMGRIEKFKLNFDELIVDMLYTRLDNHIYQKISYFGN